MRKKNCCIIYNQPGENALPDEMDVLDQRQQIRIAVAEDCLVAPLKKMSRYFVFSVEIGRVALLQPLHDL